MADESDRQRPVGEPEGKFPPLSLGWWNSLDPSGGGKLWIEIQQRGSQASGPQAR